LRSPARGKAGKAAQVCHFSQFAAIQLFRMRPKLSREIRWLAAALVQWSTTI
jgi:hypothetical protein